MKRRKIFATIATLTLVFSLGIGVSAATGAFDGKSKVSKGAIEYGDDVIIDGNSIGYWLADTTNGLGTWSNGNSTTWDAGATLTITDEDLTANSYVDIYYSEECKEIVSKAKVSYTQAEDTVIVTFEKASATGNAIPVKIEAVHIVNPKAAQ